MSNTKIQHEIKNSDLTKKVIITRVLLADGYNYYLSLYSFNKDLSSWYLNERYTQKDSILSLKNAINEANNLITSK